MFERAVDVLTNVFQGALNVFLGIYNSIPGSIQVVIVVFTVALVVDLLIMPLRGSFSSGKSDTVQRGSKSKNTSSKKGG